MDCILDLPSDLYRVMSKNLAFLNKVCTHSWPLADCGYAPGLLKLFFCFLKVCVYLSTYLSTFVCMHHVSKIINKCKSSFYVRSKSKTKSVLNFCIDADTSGIGIRLVSVIQGYRYHQ